MQLSEELRARRAELGMSQAGLADQLGVAQQTISRWEGGGSSPGPRQIVALAEVLSLNLSALLRSAGYLVASDVIVDTVRPSGAELMRMTTTELVSFVDAAWQQLRHRLVVLPANPTSVT
jgi:transcriptional regulator with XRE-family HTH domain